MSVVRCGLSVVDWPTSDYSIRPYHPTTSSNYMSPDYVIRRCHPTASFDYVRPDFRLPSSRLLSKVLSILHQIDSFHIVAKLHVALHVRVPVYTLHGENQRDMPGCMVFVTSSALLETYTLQFCAARTCLSFLALPSFQIHVVSL